MRDFLGLAQAPQGNSKYRHIEEVAMDKLASQLDQLKKSGVFTAEADELTEKEKDVLQRLTDDEVQTLIRMHKKFGPTDKGRDKIRPCFPL